MLKTKSGLPAYDAETMAQARAEYQKFYDALAHLRHCSDYDRLLMPSIKNFLRHEIENPINPVALAANLSKLAEENDTEREHKLKEQLECDEISQAKFDYEMERIKLSRMERKAELDKNPNLRKAIKKQKKKAKCLDCGVVQVFMEGQRICAPCKGKNKSANAHLFVRY